MDNTKPRSISRKVGLGYMYCVYPSSVQESFAFLRRSPSPYAAASLVDRQRTVSHCHFGNESLAAHAGETNNPLLSDIGTFQTQPRMAMRVQKEHSMILMCTPWHLTLCHIQLIRIQRHTHLLSRWCAPLRARSCLLQRAAFHAAMTGSARAPRSTGVVHAASSVSASSAFAGRRRLGRGLFHQAP